MMKYKSIYAVIILGVISGASLIYFYATQRNFTQNHREFLIHMNNLENNKADLIGAILKNSIFAYNNQDKIAQISNKLQDGIKQTENSNVLKDKTYARVNLQLKQIDTKINTFITNIQKYLMLNAGIKNSLVFLTGHVEKGLKLGNVNQNLYIKASHIVSIYTNANRMQDIDYINPKKLFLTTHSTNPKVQSFVNDFNLHSKYLFNKFPSFIQTTNLLLNNDLDNDFSSIHTLFTKIALNDFKFLDIFAAILFFTFLSSIILILALLFKYVKEHAKLLKVTASLEHSLTHDLLTGLGNRNAFLQDLQKTDKPHMLIINIDRFKHINDIYGNELGNSLLKNLAIFIKKQLSDINNKKIYRIGGDEFGILLDNINKNLALEIAYNLENVISSHNFIIGPIKLNINVAIASNNIAPVLENADLALKELKKDVNRQVIEYKEDLNLKKQVEQNLETINLIKKAIHEERVIPYFQPIINLQTLKIEKYEALVRIVQPSGDVLTPFHFLDVSKQTPYYNDVTRIMIEKTIEVAKNYPQYRFSINISMRDILNKEITDILFCTFDKNPSIASKIDIEILESEMIQDNFKIQNFIQRIHNYGSKILIDDFGTGYSNFSYFSSLDVDIIKIDGSIVNEITTSERKLHMLKSIHNFTVGMNMINVAEYVKTKEIALLLKEIGITYAQGYYFGKPCEQPVFNQEVTL